MERWVFPPLFSHALVHPFVSNSPFPSPFSFLPSLYKGILSCSSTARKQATFLSFSSFSLQPPFPLSRTSSYAKRRTREDGFFSPEGLPPPFPFFFSSLPSAANDGCGAKSTNQKLDRRQETNHGLSPPFFLLVLTLDFWITSPSFFFPSSLLLGLQLSGMQGDI